MTEQVVRAERWFAGDLVIDPGDERVIRNDAEIPLTQLSFKFLFALVRAWPRTLTIDDLMDQAWPGVFVNAETVVQRAKLLREALGDDPKTPRYVAARRGRGYQFLPEVTRVEGDDNRGLSPALAHTVKHIPRGHRGWIRIGLALAMASLTGTSSYLPSTSLATYQASASRNVAVLPFRNLSGNPSDSYIALAVPEMVLNRLSTTQGLTVIARDSAFSGQLSDRSPADIMDRLKAEYLVQGTVQRSGEWVRITCYLVDAHTGVRLWSEAFDWPVARLYAAQDKIAERVAFQLLPKTALAGQFPAGPGEAPNSEGYLAYLKGRTLLGRFTVRETEAAAVQFERAITLDPRLADAFAALYDARMQAASLRKDDMDKARGRFGPLLDRALSLKPDSGQALFAKAMWSSTDDKEREVVFRRAVELDPSNSRGLTEFSKFLRWKRRSVDDPIDKEASALIVKVRTIDPLSSRAMFMAVEGDVVRLTPEATEQRLARILELDPEFYPVAVRYSMRVWMLHGRTAEAIRAIERTIATDPENPWGPHFAAAYYLDANDPAAALAAAGLTGTSMQSTRALFAQYRGDWRGAANAAMGPRGFLFSKFENWLWADTIRDFALQTGEYETAARRIATKYEFDLANPRVGTLAQQTVAPALAQVLIAGRRQADGRNLLASNLKWIDAHPQLGSLGLGRSKARSLMLLGDRDAALSLLLASMVDGHDVRNWWYTAYHDPIWQPVRSDPRFREIVRRAEAQAAKQRQVLDRLRRQGLVPARPTPPGPT